jgi:hypothetical protein
MVSLGLVSYKYPAKGLRSTDMFSGIGTGRAGSEFWVVQTRPNFGCLLTIKY